LEIYNQQHFLIAIPTLVPLPYSKEIESTTFNDDFAKEMQKNSSEHGFGAKSMADVINQVETKNHTEKVFNKIISSAAPPRARDPACAATKGLRTTNFVLSQFIETSHVGKSFESKQASIKDFSAAIPLRHVWRSMRMMKKMKCKSLSNALVKIQFHQLHLCP
jgi:hypothetical protein